MSPKGSGRQESPGMVVRPTCGWVGLCVHVCTHIYNGVRVSGGQRITSWESVLYFHQVLEQTLKDESET